MNCDEFKNQMQLKSDHELLDDELRLTHEHLASCTACRQFERYLGNYRQMLQERALPERAPANLKQILAQKSGGSGRTFWEGFSLLRMGPVAAGLVILAYVFWNTTGGASFALKQDIVRHHARNLPLEIASADSQALGSWFNGKLDFPVNIPRMQTSRPDRPIILKGARLSNVRERPAAYVVYDDGSQHKYSLWIFPANGLDLPNAKRRLIHNRQVYWDAQDGYNLAMWKQRQLFYTLVSDADEADLVQILSHMVENR